MDDPREALKPVAEKLLIGHYARHIFLCAGDKCCSAEVGLAAWEKLKEELKNRNLSLSTGPSACYRTKVGCLRICAGGPVAVVYPEGTWYCGLTADKVSAFVEQHLVKNEPIEEMIFARNPLNAQTDPA